MNNQELIQLRNIKIHEILGITNTDRRISIRCPFHTEKTPSFWLFPDGGFKCFGCGKHGFNSIDFLMGFNISFKEAIEELRKHL